MQKMFSWKVFLSLVYSLCKFCDGVDSFLYVFSMEIIAVCSETGYVHVPLQEPATQAMFTRRTYLFYFWFGF